MSAISNHQRQVVCICQTAEHIMQDMMHLKLFSICSTRLWGAIHVVTETVDAEN